MTFTVKLEVVLECETLEEARAIAQSLEVLDERGNVPVSSIVVEQEVP